jgi:hypothetical protein
VFTSSPPNRRALDQERRTIIRLRNQDVINDEVLRRIQRDIDLGRSPPVEPAVSRPAHFGLHLIEKTPPGR